MPHQYKLTYFNVMGLGEPIRFLLSYGGHQFQDFRVDRLNEWPKMKPDTPFGQLPILEIDGKPYCQSVPICRYLAKQMDLIGETDLDALQIDSIVEALYELRKHVALFYRESNPEIKATRKEEVLTKTLPFYLNKLESCADNGYFVNGKLSYADIFFAAIHDSLVNACGVEITKEHPNLKKIRENVLYIPKIKEWVDKRPQLEF
ncbi:GSCOCT00006541001.3-RA-CDS [Cotesia congregata]|uniref:glutathione transferase n=1 Tax=Cotesia congregata TaxID=51543 RepID=A0A8J2HPX2_COTCN|nr:GSCOCT00006541001.3-RA-CDS [Cotesia congregata]CAG5106430.1 glutathione S-transferase Sigma 4 [Cotesia congregata]